MNPKTLINLLTPRWKLNLGAHSIQTLIASNEQLTNTIQAVNTSIISETNIQNDVESTENDVQSIVSSTKNLQDISTNLPILIRLAQTGSIAIQASTSKTSQYEMLIPKHMIAASARQISNVMLLKLQALKLKSKIYTNLFHPKLLELDHIILRQKLLKESITPELSKQIFLMPQANGNLTIRIMTNCYQLRDNKQLENYLPKIIKQSSAPLFTMETTINLVEKNKNLSVTVDKIQINGYENIPKECTTPEFQKKAQPVSSLFGKIFPRPKPVLIEESEQINGHHTLQQLPPKAYKTQESDGFKILIPMKKPGLRFSGIFFRATPQLNKQDFYLKEFKNSLNGWFGINYKNFFTTLIKLSKDNDINNYTFLQTLNPNLLRKFNEILAYTTTKITDEKFEIIKNAVNVNNTLIEIRKNQKNKIKSILKNLMPDKYKHNEAKIYVQQINAAISFTTNHKLLVSALLKLGEQPVEKIKKALAKLNSPKKLLALLDCYCSILEKEKRASTLLVQTHKAKLENIEHELRSIQSLISFRGSHSSITLNDSETNEFLIYVKTNPLINNMPRQSRKVESAPQNQNNSPENKEKLEEEQSDFTEVKFN